MGTLLVAVRRASTRQPSDCRHAGYRAVGAPTLIQLGCAKFSAGGANRLTSSAARRGMGGCGSDCVRCAGVASREPRGSHQHPRSAHLDQRRRRPRLPGAGQRGHRGELLPQFGTACGTFLALTEGEDVVGEGGHHLFGSNPPAGRHPRSGLHVPENPRRSPEMALPPNPFVGQHPRRRGRADRRRKKFLQSSRTNRDRQLHRRPGQLRNDNHSQEPRGPRAERHPVHAGDCYLANLDKGFGAENCLPSARWPARLIATTVRPPGSWPSRRPSRAALLRQHIESFYATVWSYLTPTEEPSSRTPSTPRAQTMNPRTTAWACPGLSGLSIFGSAGRLGDAEAHDHRLVRQVPRLPAPCAPSASPGGACVSNEKFPVTISAVNGEKDVHYKGGRRGRKDD